jgi:hypothetical protein
MSRRVDGDFRGSPRLTLKQRREAAKRCRSMALVLTLAILVLMTVLVVAFLSTVTLDRQATANYARSLQADSLALGALDQVVSQIQAEIADPANSTPIGAMYEPIGATNAVPQRTSSLAPIVTYSGKKVYNNAANFASTSLTTTPSANNRFVSMNRWYQPQLTLTTSGFPVPQWVLVARNGTYPTTWDPSLVNHALGNGNYVVGRYAYVVYDTSGLIDINVAGYPSSVPTGTAANKGALSWVDLTQLTNAINQSDVDNLIAWRNNSNVSTYASYATNWATNGFMQVAQGDTTFLSRQELIKYAQQATNAITGLSDWTNALPFLTTFSRELNGPTWGPATNGNSSYPYIANSTSTTFPSDLNPLVYNPKVVTSFVRNNGTTAIVGEPLMKYRFPLDKLALLEGATNGTSNVNADLIARYFGLDIAPLPGPYRHFIYPTTNPNYPHGLGTSITSGSSTGIMSLDDVAALPNNGYPGREPDFFELLQAGILSGSLGVHNFASGTVNTAYARSDFTYGYNNSHKAPSYRIPNGGTSLLVDPDTQTGYQILRIGANIIDQWHADNYPTTITSSFSFHGATWAGVDVYGICDLPYINALFVLAYNQAANYGTGSAIGPTIYICPQLWNPHQPSGATVGPSQFVLVTDSNHGAKNTGDAWSFYVQAPGVDEGSPYVFSGGTWYYNPYTQSYGSTNSPDNFFSTNVIAFSAQSTDYRDPNAITTAASTNVATGLWNSSPPVGAIQLSFPLPPSTMLAATAQNGMTNAPYILSRVAAANSITNAYPLNNGSLILNWAQATNTVNYYGQTNINTAGVATNSTGPAFNLPANSPVYQTSFSWNGVFAVEYLNPIDGNYYPYGTFEGLYNATNLETGFVSTLSPGMETNAATPAAPFSFAEGWMKSDPRTFRMGPGQKSEPDMTATAGVAIASLSLNPTNTASSATLTNTINNSVPFYGIGSSVPQPYRLDLWAVNDTNLTGLPTSPTIDNRYSYADPDGITRYGDAHYAYSSGGGYATPFLTGQPNNRPVILHRPFRSVGELGYVFRDDPWRTLDFSSPVSADAGLLDLFTISDGQVVTEHNGQKTMVVAGRVNPNTPYPSVLAAMMAGGTQNISGGSTLPGASALSLGNNVVAASSALPFMNRADFVSRIMTNTSSASLYLKTDREAIARSLAESFNTRTWNFLIDIVAQSGTYPPTANSLDNFVVGGERHYWLHVAIDRYTGQVVDRQLEEVSQ